MLDMQPPLDLALLLNLHNKGAFVRYECSRLNKQKGVSSSWNS